MLFTRMTYKRTGSVRSTWRGARTLTIPPSAAEVLARANMECNDICGEPGSSEALNKCLPPSPFLESDISPAFKNQICAIPVNLRSNKEHVSLLQNPSISSSQQLQAPLSHHTARGQTSTAAPCSGSTQCPSCPARPPGTLRHVDRPGEPLWGDRDRGCELTAILAAVRVRGPRTGRTADCPQVFIIRNWLA